jgi:hypothetical protein
MTDEELRAVAEAAKGGFDGQWYEQDDIAHMHFDDFIAAASPNVVLGLLDRIKALKTEAASRQDAANASYRQGLADGREEAASARCEIARLEDLLACFVPGPQTDAINRLIAGTNAGVVAERDEAREAVRRLAGALTEIAKGIIDRKHATAGRMMNHAAEAVGDEVVWRIVEGE